MLDTAKGALAGAALGIGLLGMEEALHLGLGESPVPAGLLARHAALYAAVGAVGGLMARPLRLPAAAGVAAAFATVLLAARSPPLGVVVVVAALVVATSALVVTAPVVVARLRTAAALVTARPRSVHGPALATAAARVTAPPRLVLPLATAAALATVALPAVNLHAFASPLDPAALVADVVVLAAVITAAYALERVPAAWSVPWVVVVAASRPPSLPEPRPADGRPPLVIVLVDTLRADHLGAYGHPGGLTPHLDALAARAVVYEQAQSAAPWTVPAVASLFTGVLPSEHGAGIVHEPLAFAGLREEVPTLVGDLRRFGYVTGGLVANPWLRGFSGLGRDFDHWDDRATGHQPLLARALDRRIAMDAPPYLTADVQTDRAIAWIDQQGDGPWLLVVHYMDPHSPYAPPHPYRDGAHPHGLYEGEVRFVDAEIGRLLAHVPEAAWVAVVADHGETFGDHDAPADVPPGTRHGHTLYQELLHVPLIVRPPHGSMPRRVARPVRAHDLLPTLLVAAGVPVREGLDAEPLVELVGGRAATNRPARSEQILFGAEQKAVRLGRWKLVRGPGGRALFDLDADPSERHDRALDAPTVADELEPLLPAGELRPGDGPDRRTRAMLEALGYALDDG